VFADAENIETSLVCEGNFFQRILSPAVKFLAFSNDDYVYNDRLLLFACS
jgi:hypothetical protein